MIEIGRRSALANVCILGALLAIAACQVPIPEAENDVSYENDAIFNSANAVNPADAAIPAPLTDVPGAAGRIPVAFQGRWGLVPADCTSTLGDDKGLMTIEADRLTFYESRATVAQLETISPTELKATLAFTGEGQEWTQETPLVLEQNGEALTRTVDGQTLRYTRCGA